MPSGDQAGSGVSDGVVRDLDPVGPVEAHRVDLVVAVLVAYERQPASIGRPVRSFSLTVQRARQRDRVFTAVHRHGPEIRACGGRSRSRTRCAHRRATTNRRFRRRSSRCAEGGPYRRARPRTDRESRGPGRRESGGPSGDQSRGKPSARPDVNTRRRAVPSAWHHVDVIVVARSRASNRPGPGGRASCAKPGVPCVSCVRSLPSGSTTKTWASRSPCAFKTTGLSKAIFPFLPGNAAWAEVGSECHPGQKTQQRGTARSRMP